MRQEAKGLLRVDLEWQANFGKYGAVRGCMVAATCKLHGDTSAGAVRVTCGVLPNK